MLRQKVPLLLVTILFVLGLVGFSYASRNANGTYTLPAGNPVVSGTTITSTWANNTLNDLATEMTNSLDRQGRGAMSAPLKLADGTNSAPGLTFSSDTDTGLYRSAGNTLSVSGGGVQLAAFAASSIAFTQTLYPTATNTNGPGVWSIGNGIGPGVIAWGGSSDAPGLSAKGGSVSAPGVLSQGADAGAGGVFYGGAYGRGVEGYGRANMPGGYFVAGQDGGGVVAIAAGAGSGVIGTGAGLGVGGLFTAGTSATAFVRYNAISATNGDIDMTGVTNPSATTAVSEAITPMSFAKAWGVFTLSGSVPMTTNDGLNFTSAEAPGGIATAALVTLASGCATANYAVTANVWAGGGTPILAFVTAQTTTTFTLAFWDVEHGNLFTGSSTPSWTTATNKVHFVVHCRQ